MRRQAMVMAAVAAAGVLGLAQWSAAASPNFAVGIAGMSAYVIDGANNPTLTLTRGQTYTFAVSAFGHPFWLTTQRGSGDTEAHAFTLGVTNNGASPGTITFAVPASAPSTLYYQCSFHDTMGGTLQVVSAPAAAAPALAPVAALGLAGGLLGLGLVLARRRARAAS